MSVDNKKGDSIKTLEGIFLQGVRFQRHEGLKKLWKLQAVFRHREMVEDIAANTGARRTDGAGVKSGPGI